MNTAFGTMLSLATSLVLVFGFAGALRGHLRPFLSRQENSQGDEFRSNHLADLVCQIFALALILTLNQFFGLASYVPALLLLLVLSFRRPSASDGWLFTAFAVTAIAVCIWTLHALNLSGLWMTEGINHDIFFYVRGGDWALAHGTLNADDVISRELMFGQETADCVWWIGDACRLHRGGTHTLAGLTGLLRGEVTPGMSYLATLLIAPPLISALMLNRGATPSINRPFGYAPPIALCVLLVASAPVFTSLANGNLATALAALCIMCSVLIFVSRTAQSNAATTSIALGALTGLAAQVYSESMWVVAAITAAHVAITSVRLPLSSAAARFFRFSGLALAAWLLAGNVSILMAFRAFFTVSAEVTRDLYWPNYYLDAEAWRWLSMPFAGWLEGTNQLYPSMLGAIGTLSVVLLCALSPNRLRLVIALLLVVFAITVIELTTYFYGVHKVVELFGGVVLATGAACLMQGISPLTSRAGQLAVVALSFLFLAILAHSTMNFGGRVKSTLIGPYAPKSISYEEAKLFARLNEDDAVLLNDLPWSAADRFSKSHWSAFLAEREKARLVMGDFGGESYRGGYGASDRERTLTWHDHIDWVVQMSDLPAQREFVFYEGASVVSAGRFELVDLRGQPLAAVFMSHGFHEREPERIWTTGAFVVEAVAPATNDTEQAVLDFQLEFFAPPADGFVVILRNGDTLETISPASGTITVPLEDGYQLIEFRPSWQPVSPADIEVSGDSRKLFASVFKITSRMAPEAHGSEAPQYGD